MIPDPYFSVRYDRDQKAWKLPGFIPHCWTLARKHYRTRPVTEMSFPHLTVFNVFIPVTHTLVKMIYSWEAMTEPVPFNS
jgi:hypothetical protein